MAEVFNELPRSPKILAHVVTYNNANTITPCLSALLSQKGFSLGETLTICVTDNASSDATVEVIQRHFSHNVRLNINSNNRGFCGANNDALRLAAFEQFDYLLLVNPDLKLKDDALLHLTQTLELDYSAAIACPLLLRSDISLNPISPQRYDATGMYITPALRHFDRGSGRKRNPKYEQPAYVFGASGACLLLRMSAAKDLSLSDDSQALELFDEAFFAYREDADLAWRAAWLGWKVRYDPTAIGYHLRKVLPKGRSKLPQKLNALGVQNRFLLQLNNFTFALGARCTIAAFLRNALVILTVLLWEKSSKEALKNVWKLKASAQKRRNLLFGRARECPARVKRWFSFRPYSEPTLIKAKQCKAFRSLTIIIVNFNSGNRLSNCLGELAQAQSLFSNELSVNIVAIDNGSHDASASKIKPIYDSIEGFAVIINEENRGFAAAINQAANDFPADAFLVLNPDICVGHKTIKQLLTTLQSYSNLGTVSPVLLDDFGKSQVGFIARNFPTLRATLAELFFLHRFWPNNPWTKAYHLLDQPLLTKFLNLEDTKVGEPGYCKNYPVIVDQPAGACLMIRGTVFEQLEGFDERFWPAWFEDVDFCKRLQKIGYQNAIVANVTAKHEGGHSVQSISAGTYIQAWYGNLTRYWKKHGSILDYLIIRAAVPIALLLRFAYFSFKAGTPNFYNQAANTDDLKEALLKTAANPTKKKN